MKRFLLTAAATLLITTPVLAAQVEVNGTAIDAEAVIVDGRTLVPVRGVFEELGYTVDYAADTKTATLTKGNTVVSMTMGNDYFTVNDEVVTPEVPQQIIDSRFMLPLRAVSEAIGARVEWDSETKTASISTGLKVVEVQDFSTDAPVNNIVID
jgi:hypothetical protein